MMFSKNLSAALLIVTVMMIFNLEKSNGDISTNCKRKVRDRWMDYCINEGVSRSKRETTESRSSMNRAPRGSASRQEVPVPVASDILPESSKGQEILVPARAFSAPASGDDLHTGITMSHNQMEELCDEMMDRFPRGARNKESIMKMITAYAARCCNENLDDANCSDPVTEIKCP